MKDLITFAPNIPALIAELEQVAPQYIVTDEVTGEKTFTVWHTPIVKNENGSLALSRVTADGEALIASMTSIKSLGTYDEMFADPVALAKYKLVYPYDVPVEYTDEDGVVRQYMRPERIGVFA
jgi:hypothetical protein